MKLANALAPLTELRLAISTALVPTLVHILRHPASLLHPSELSRLFFAHVWTVYGPGADKNGRVVKETLIPPYTSGVVLDLGAGHGHTANYLNKDRVTKYIALEPNALMHDNIREIAREAGFVEKDGSLVILGCGAGETNLINSVLGGENQVDTVISILTLCTVPDAKAVIETLSTRVLKAGGQFLFYEHVASHRSDVRWWQSLWTPLWKLYFDGCRLDVPADRWIAGLGVWDEDESKIWGKEGETEENLWWHRVGRFVKRQSP